MSAGTGQWPGFTGLGGAVHIADPFLNWLERRRLLRALKRLGRPVEDGTAAEIKAAREHLIEVTR